LLLNRVARIAHAPVCGALLPEAAGATASEALALYRLATAAGEVEMAEKALLLLGRRAEKGAMIDGVPLSMMVGDLLRAQGQSTQAIAWFRRAFEECPDDARPALRLAETVPEERAAMLRHAYARGERAPAFMVELATALAAAGDHLATLAMLDDLCTRDPRAEHFEMAARTCLALDRTDWAQQRIQAYTGPAAPGLQRLDLICELQRNGLSDRAKSLAKAWHEGGNKDEFVEGLLKKYGG
jgi:tetratricopeptide (TPR) repeat protein